MIAKLLVLHYIADFLLQPREMGQKKSSEPKWLLAHLAIQFAIFAPFTSAWFALANCAVHGVIDWYIWRGYKLTAYYRIRKDVIAKYGSWTQPPEEDVNIKAGIASWQYWTDKIFYDTIGFDQLLHGLTLVTLAGWLL